MKWVVTSALPYINGPPHLGHIVGCLLPADIFARFLKLKGEDCIYVTGTDEHGTPLEVEALKKGVPLEELKRVYRNIHFRCYGWFKIDADVLGYTTNPYHYDFTQQFFLTLKERGYIVEREMEQFYCPKCERFLADRFVVGTCSYCGYERARGDQCERCGRAMDIHTLKNPKCVICGSNAEIRTTKHLFLRLDLLERDVRDYIEKVDTEDWIKNYAFNWMKEGLRERAITRNAKNGVPVPGYDGKVFYVWFDAPLGYISFLGEKMGDAGLRRWNESKIVQFMGKDNIPFHLIMFPAMLIAHGGFKTADKIVALHFLNFEGGKFSKSEKRGVFIDKLLDSDLDPEYMRFYLVSIMPHTHDADFSWTEFMDRINGDFIGNIVNFVYRVLKLAKGDLIERDVDGSIKGYVEEKAKEIEQHYLNARFREALKGIIDLAGIGNRYLNEKEPWKNREEKPKILYNCLEMARIIALSLYPITPSIAEKIIQMLRVEKKWIPEFGWKDVYEIEDVERIADKIDKEKVEEWRKTLQGPKDYF